MRPTRLFREAHFKQLPERIITQLGDAYKKHPPSDGRPSHTFLEVAARVVETLCP